MAAQSKAWVCDYSPAGIAGSNLPGDMDVSCVMCCQVDVFHRTDHLSGGVLPSVLFLSMSLKP